MKKLKTYLASAVAVAGGMVAPYVALAQSNPSPFQTASNYAANVGNAAGVKGSTDLPTIIGNIINILLGFLGILFLVLLLWAGFEWMTAGGDDKKVQDATKRIRNAVIGLVVIVAGFAISNFVLTSLIKVTGN
jgi:hypothetical protein